MQHVAQVVQLGVGDGLGAEKAVLGIEVDLQVTDMALNLSPDVVVSILVKVPDLVKMASMVSTAPRDDDAVRARESGKG